MASQSAEILGFIAEWYDPQPMMTRQYLTKVFVEDNDVELYDKKTGKCFLRKSPMPGSHTPSDFYVGAKVSIHSRIMTIVDYADPYTRRKLGKSIDTATVLLSPDAFYEAGKIIEDLTSRSGLKVSKLQSFGLKESELADLLPLLGVEGAYEQVVKFWCSGMSVAVELKGADCYDLVRQLVPQIKKRYGTSDLEGAAWTADGLGDFFFGSLRSFPTTATLQQCTCAVIRPHAVKSPAAFGPILDAILADRRFVVSAMQMFELDKASAKEFLEVYEQVMPSYNDMVTDLCMGPVVALEVKLASSQGGGGGVVGAFREFVGPWDVEMAKELRPDTIRARHGLSRTQNAIHCTDLPEDGVAECAYFFDVLQGS